MSYSIFESERSHQTQNLKDRNSQEVKNIQDTQAIVKVQRTCFQTLLKILDVEVNCLKMDAKEQSPVEKLSKA